MRPKISEWDGTKRTYVQLKYDGHWTEIHKHDGVVTVFTRHPTDITEKMLWHPSVQAVHLRANEGDIILGELYVEGGTSSNVKTAINNQDVKFVAFGVGSMLAGVGMRAVESYCLNLGIPFANWRHYRGETAGQLLQSLPALAEGYVLKDGNLTGWAKLKRHLTCECVVTGYTEGTRITKIAGLKVSLYKDGRLQEVASVSGMTDAERLLWTRLFAEDVAVGKVIEVAYTGTTNPRSGLPRLRHPRFVGERTDKVPTECVWEQVWPVPHADA